MKKITVTFETKCYENDWEFLLRTNGLRNMISRCNFNFNKKALLINNVNDPDRVRYYAARQVKNGVIDEYYFVDEFADEALNFFDIDKSSFNGGYYYSIAELVSIFLTKTNYLVHFSSDTMMENNNANWIAEAIALMETDHRIFAANPVWNGEYAMAKRESFSEDDRFYYSYGFSDQCYLVKTDAARGKIYSEHNIATYRYPKYGGESFEKRVGSYMRNHDLWRATFKGCTYIHDNFPKNPVARALKKLSMGLF